MADYPPNEIVDIIRILGETGNNYSAAERLYAERYPNRRHPCRKTIRKLTERAQQGSLKRIRQKSGPNAEKSLVVLDAAVLNPQISTRQIERQHGISKSTANRILKINRFHPYHIHLTHQLEPRDFERRLQFCNWALNQIQRNPHFIAEMLSSDEATFGNRGGVNRHNSHYYSDQNPHWQRSQEFQRQWSINVWAGILGNNIIGPYSFEQHLNALNYFTFLQNDLPNLLRHINNDLLNRMWFQQDGAPAHRSRNVTNFLNNRFPNRWIGMGSRTHK